MYSKVIPALAVLGLTLTYAPVWSASRSTKKTSGSPVHVWILTKDRQSLEGTLAGDRLTCTVEGKTRQIPLRDLLSVHTGDAPSPQEQARISAGLAEVAGTSRPAREAASADLTDIGLPVLTPLLDAYKDTDLREPNPLYRLFGRIIPGYADQPDRTQDLIRLANGETLRGEVQEAELKLSTAGQEAPVPVANIRRLAVRRGEVERTLEVHSLRHCTQIEFLDTGLAVTPSTRLEETAEGYVRCSFGIDGWSSDANGLTKPGSPSYKTNLVDGFPFGALVGRVGPAGERWMAGRRAVKTGLGSGRLYLAVNDNAHWQNNIGSFRVKLRATDVYDLGDPQ